MEINKLHYKNKGYSRLLREIASPPKQLFYLGDETLLNTPSVAIVGSRQASAYGRKAAFQIASDLARAGITIVSGLARGIDTIAHQAALEVKGKTVAVMAGGLDRIYPPENRSLAIKILRSQGLVVSEYAKGAPIQKQNFAARNRIISGLSLGTVVVEAATRSGALITASFALEQNRVVMAVPGNTTSDVSAGANRLIQAGAQLVASGEDVLAALGLEAPLLKTTAPKAASQFETTILALLAKGINDAEELLAQSGLGSDEFNRTITLMEISGKVRNLGGGKWLKR